jgi:hypothetical protein
MGRFKVGIVSIKASKKASDLLKALHRLTKKAVSAAMKTAGQSSE